MELAMTNQAAHRYSIKTACPDACAANWSMSQTSARWISLPAAARARRSARCGCRAAAIGEPGLRSPDRGAPGTKSFSSGDCEFLRQLSEHVALAAHQAQLYYALQQAYDDLRQTQQAVMQQERLRALGQMASGIAHDINNAISPVALYTELLLETEPNLSARARDYLETTQRAIDDVAHTVARMREFYRQREPQLILAPVDLNRLVQQVLDLTRARWSDMPQQRGIVIDMRTELRPRSAGRRRIESEIREALTNLIFNAVDAMPDGGTLTLRTQSRARRAGTRSMSTWKWRIPAWAWTRKRAAVAWSRSSPPKANAAPAWVWPWCMGSRSGITRTSKSKARVGRRNDRSP